MSDLGIEQYREFLQKLSRGEGMAEVLNDIKNFLVFKPPSEAIVIIRNAGISKLVHCLNVKDKSQIELACEVLKICFSKFSIGDVVKNYTSHVMYLLRHEKECVRRLAIDEIHNTIKADPALLPVPLYIDLFVAVCQMVCDESVGVASQAVVISSSLPSEVYPKILEEMKIALDHNSSSKCNAYEVVINISEKSYELFQLCVDQGYIEFIVTELESDDILYKMNILDLLSRMAVKPHGINYLVKQGLLNKIVEIVPTLNNQIVSAMLIPGYLKFFGNIAYHYPSEIFNKYPALVDFMFDTLESMDDAVVPTAVDTLGFIGSTIEGKLSLVALGRRYIAALEKIGEIINNRHAELKIRSLYCLANLVSVDKGPNVAKSGVIDHRVTLMTREWFRSMSNNPSSMEKLYEICKNPFPDIRQAAFTLLDATCQHRWGEELVASVAGFIEYLLDRSVNHTKETKETKYDIVKKLSRSSAFNSSIIMRLKTYVEQGPFYVESEMEVAMEERD